MSCKPPSEFLERFDKYDSSLGKALSVAGAPLGEVLEDDATKVVSTIDVRSGIGSSGFFD